MYTKSKCPLSCKFHSYYKNSVKVKGLLVKSIPILITYPSSDIRKDTWQQWDLLRCDIRKDTWPQWDLLRCLKKEKEHHHFKANTGKKKIGVASKVQNNSQQRLTTLQNRKFIGPFSREMFTTDK